MQVLSRFTKSEESFGVLVKVRHPGMAPDLMNKKLQEEGLEI